jgi:hypothetical protein
MQTTADTNKSFALFQKVFQSKNTADIWNRLFVTNTSVYISLTKNHVPNLKYFAFIYSYKLL